MRSITTRLGERTAGLERFARNPIVLAALFGLLIICSFIPFFIPNLVPSLPQPSISWEGFFSFAQFISSVLLIPVILIGFEFQRREFEAAQAKPVLDLAFRNALGQLGSEVVVQPEFGHELFTFQVSIELLNRGQAVATLYKVELNGLDALGFGPDGYSEWFEEMGVLGQDWRDQTRTNGPLVFLGFKNEHSIFPQQGAGICRLAVNLRAANVQRQFSIPYTLYSGITNPRSGTLQIKLRESESPILEIKSGAL